jgi:hypothetical protein
LSLAAFPDAVAALDAAVDLLSAAYDAENA